MYIKESKKQTSLLNIDERFVTLAEIVENQDTTFANFIFSFKISKFEAINNNAFSVLVTLKKPNIISEPNILSYKQNGEIDSINSKKIVKNILNHHLKILNVNKQKSDLIIATKVADISSKINNQIISAVRTNQPISNLGLQKTSLVVKSKTNKQLTGDREIPLESINIENDYYKNAEINQRKTRLELLKKFNIPPSKITDVSETSISASDSFSGVYNLKNVNRNNNNLNLLLNSYTRDVEKNSLNQFDVLVSQFFDDTATIDVPITINDFFEVASTNLTISFELLSNYSSNGTTQTVVLEKVEKIVNLLDYYQKVSSSRKNLKLGFSTNDTNVFVSVINDRQKNKISVSDKFNKINVYKKDLQGNNSSTYSLVESREYSGFSTNEFLFSFLNNKDNSLYRVHNEGQTEFQDFVTKNTLVNVSRKVVSVPYLFNNKIFVLINDVNNCLFDVVSIKVLYRDVSIRQKSFTINEIVDCSRTDTTISEYSSEISRGLIPYHVYEITTSLILNNGVEVSSNHSSFIDFYPSSITKISLNDLNHSITQDDISFDLGITLLDDQIGTLKALLQQVSAKYDEDALVKRKANYDRFVAFNVIRYDLNSGEADDLGIIPNLSRFSDKESSLKVSAKPLVPGSSYRYVIYPLFRNPYDVINEKETIVDEVTRKKYTINPRKHLHPLTLTRGYSFSNSFLNSSFNTEQDMLNGKVGASFIFNAFVPRQNAIIKDFSIFKMDKKRIMLTWKIVGDKNTIDHMILMKEINGVKSIIGKSHSFYQDCSFVYELSSNDLGNIRFLLSPIYSDYSSSSNLIVSDYVLINSL